MSEPEKEIHRAHEETSLCKERTKQVEFAAWTAGLTALLGVGIFATNSSWPTAFGVATLSAMVTIVCYFILKKK